MSRLVATSLGGKVGGWNFNLRKSATNGLRWHMRSLSTIAAIERCPSPTCACQDTPPDLKIDHLAPLYGTMAPYHEHVVLRTGRSDWPSRIEEDPNLPVIKWLKSALGRKGKFSNPFHNVMISTSSLETSHSASDPAVLLFPSFISIPSIPYTYGDTESVYEIHRTSNIVERFIRGFLLPEKPDPRALDTPGAFEVNLKRDPGCRNQFDAAEVTNVTILICGHESRDSRCGIMGPILQQEFVSKLEKESLKNKFAATVEMISHIGGHKFAGNVIIYVPPNLDHPLAGKGVWYGRVEPFHVEGIVSQTIENGLIIKELFRGGLDQDAKLLTV